MLRFWCFFLLFFGVLWAQAPAQVPKDPYIGSQACRGCHLVQTQDFFRNAHTKSDRGCEGCHGPGRAHVNAGGKKDLIIAFSVLTPQKSLDNCLQCHSKDMSRANIRRSSHTQAEVVCANCHSIHKSATPKHLLAHQQKDLCYTCHTDVKAQFSMPFKHRVNEGTVQCSDCHNPHGAPAPTWRMGQRPRMQQHAQANEQSCVQCHADKRGPFLFEHAALRVDGCNSCHAPHGSANPRLLNRPVIFTLCLECHNGAAGFGRTGEGIPTQSSSHNMADPRYQNCTTCHVKIHGSNANASFLR